jgi:hypothetical protein
MPTQSDDPYQDDDLFELPPPKPIVKRHGRRRLVGGVPRLSQAEIDALMAPPKPVLPEPPNKTLAIEIPEAEPDDPTGLSESEKGMFRAVLAEIVSRRNESLRLFKPMPEQERFFASDASERIALGGNRGGKTTVTVVEAARALTGQDPYDKYPRESGKCILVGKDLVHCSKVFYQKLFKPGAFKVIKDEVTGEYRSYNPNDPDDAARAHEAKKAPPLIPARFYDYKKIAWENKKDEIPKTIPLKNGWTLYFFSSLGVPPQGWNVDLVVFDEEIEHPLWYPEMSARLLDNRTIDPETGKVRGGKFIWSATPQAGTEQLYDLKTRADVISDEPNPVIECFEYGMLENQWVSDSAKQEFINKFADNEDELNVRVYGKFALLGTRIYPEFTPKGCHGIPAMPIPEQWTSYAIVDPGRQVCAVLFVAVAPPGSQWAGRKIVYDELYIKKCNAEIFAEAFVRRVAGRPIEYGIIDHHAGRQHELGSGKQVEQQYSDALAKRKFKFETGGTSFKWGDSDVKAGIEATRTAMHVIDGKSELVVMWEKCPNLCKELEKYSYRKLPNGTVTDEPIKLNDHLADCLRYTCSAKLAYRKPRARKRQAGYTTEILKAKKERAKARKQRDGVPTGYRVG